MLWRKTTAMLVAALLVGLASAEVRAAEDEPGTGRGKRRGPGVEKPLAEKPPLPAFDDDEKPPAPHGEKPPRFKGGAPGMWAPGVKPGEFGQPGKGFGGPLAPGMHPGQMTPGAGGFPGGPQLMGHRGPHFGSPRPEWGHLERQDPEMFKLIKEDEDLDRKARELSMRYRQAPPDERTTLKKELTELVDRQFEVRQQRRSLELKRLEEEIKRLREALDRRKEARSSLVGKRIAQLIGEDEDAF